MKTRGRKSRFTAEQKEAMCLDYYKDPDMSLDDFAAKYGISRATAASYYRDWKKKQEETINRLQEEFGREQADEIGSDYVVYYD